MKASEIIDAKEKLIEELNEVNKTLLIVTTNYKQKQSKLWLETDWAEAIGKAKPTVDEKKAYISLNTLEERMNKESTIYLKDHILKQIDLCDDKLMVCDE